MNRQPRMGWIGSALVLACSTLGAAWLGGCNTMNGPDFGVHDVTASDDDTAGDGGAANAGGSGIPCDVGAVLKSRCQSCHSSHPSAPMPLITLADLQAPARSDASKKVYELALERMTSATNPMPPSQPLAAEEIAAFAAWAHAGAPKTQCATDTAEAGTECIIASDCPGALVCRAGTCDVECVTDKDCTATWTCEESRCQPPAVTAAPTYSAVTTVAAWSTTKLTQVATESYSGTVFDGRYVYFAPQFGGPVMRYDTKSGFTSARAWATFDVTALDPKARSYRGAVFDGRFVYLVPSGAGATLARYDTLQPYADPASWTLFDLKTVTQAAGFVGATFDGRYVYLTPSDSTVTLRYDTAGAMTSPTSWSSFKISSVNPAAISFVGSVAAGRYVYYVPNGGAAGPRGVIARYDADASFTSAASWTTLDLATFDVHAAGYRTGAFDGRYLYLVPGWTAPTPSWATSTIARYDTLAPFAARASWKFFDTSAVDPGARGFNAAAFDGRRLILAPGYNGAYHGLTLAFDTTADITLATSWSVFDMTSLDGGVRNLRGASFDGRYVYYAPALGNAARFDARPFAAGAALPTLGGSFY
ncbi:MAG: peptidylglycine alpha-amidating monooxygenase [Labilithrix sp.]|nr:peptidylglycine alpha-amidating monooxygenase [Labilithrix sp.]